MLPALQERIDAMQSIIAEPARLVDAFFHEREARLSLDYWLKEIDGAGLSILGLMDRYAELDDLPNPLQKVPPQNQLQARIDDLRFENNLEFYLFKHQSQSAGPLTFATPLNLRRRLPPLAWQRYAETRGLGKLVLWQLWQTFLSYNFEGRSSYLDRWARRINPLALQRLSRLGALFPDQFQSRELKKLLLAPMQTFMEAPALKKALVLKEVPQLQRQLERILIEKKLPMARIRLIEERILRAQSL
jgi:hypothetical protein